MSIVGGSSPLARGLLWACGCRFGLVGIIPARAGFTQCQVPVHLPGPDHPRSRGVYGFEAFVLDGAAGSSPLARGLLWQGLVRPPRRGIIPARAGFTCRGSRTGLRRWDHPRSRGVYCVYRVGHGGEEGSSPLARGLRHGRVDRRGDPRIIPARAGFTEARLKNVGAEGDHPRSRGVYGLTGRRRLWARGSSPLARGLHDGPGGLWRCRGIIPARAGFTERGQQSGIHRQGSSPLARGLPS